MSSYLTGSGHSLHLYLPTSLRRLQETGCGDRQRCQEGRVTLSQIKPNSVANIKYSAEGCEEVCVSGFIQCCFTPAWDYILLQKSYFQATEPSSLWHQTVDKETRRSRGTELHVLKFSVLLLYLSTVFTAKMTTSIKNLHIKHIILCPYLTTMYIITWFKSFCNISELQILKYLHYVMHLFNNSTMWMHHFLCDKCPS